MRRHRTKPAPTLNREILQERRRVKALAVSRQLESSKDTGEFQARVRNRGGRRKALVVGHVQPLGGQVANPATTFSRLLRQRLRLYRTAPCTVYDGAGRQIATITTDPVTGRRTRATTS